MDDDWFRANDKGYNRTTARSRELRNNATEAERILWHHIRNRQLDDVRFNRQFPVGQFICDFASRERRLVIELDGGHHVQTAEYDERRTRFHSSQGYQVIRFWNSEVIDNIDGVLIAIGQVLANRPSPNPSRGREGRLWSPAARGGRKP